MSSGDGKADLGKKLQAAAAVGVALIFVGGSLAPFFQGTGGLSEEQLNARLSRVPVFSVTDAEGRPFVTEKDDGSRVGYFFLDPTDAERYEKRARDVGPALQGDGPRVYVVGLDQALKFVEKRDNRVGSDKYVLLGSDHEREIASESLPGLPRPKVPLFYVDGLGLSVRGDGNSQTQVVPLYFNQEDLESAVGDLSRRDSSFQPGKTEIIELDKALEEIRSGRNGRLQSVYFIAPSDAQAYLQKFQQTGESSSQGAL